MSGQPALQPPAHQQQLLHEHVMQSPDVRREASMRHETGPMMSISTTHKRKRELPDQHPADATRRAGFRRAPANSNADGGAAHRLSHDPSAHAANELTDPSAASFMSEHASPSQTGTAEDEMHPSSATSLEFGSMSQQHHHAEPTGQQNGGPDPSDATSTAAAALAGIYPTMTVPQPTDLSFASAASGPDPDRNLDPSFGLTEHDGGQHPHGAGNFDIEGVARQGQQQLSGRESSSSQKPTVGSDEWHRVRRDNHKEVERRRRETINEGINELAKIVPGCEKNKGSILQRAVSFITQLKENEAQNIEKWTLEKLLTEQAIAELSTSVEKLKNECERAWREADMWRKTCEKAGLNPRGEDGNAGNVTKDGDA